MIRIQSSNSTSSRATARHDGAYSSKTLTIPVSRIAGLTITGPPEIEAGSDDGGGHHHPYQFDPTTQTNINPQGWLWQAVGVCAWAEQRCVNATDHDDDDIDHVATHRRDGCHKKSDAPLAALTFIEINLDVPAEEHVSMPILGPLTTRYPALVRSLRVLRIMRNRHDESADLAAFATLATRLQELTFQCCAITSVRGLAGRCEFLQKVDFWGCKRLDELEGLERHAYLEEVNAFCTPISTMEPLQTCPALTILNLQHCNQVRSLDGLEDHLCLKDVNVSHTAISSMKPLLSCPALTKVDVRYCRLLPAKSAKTLPASVEVLEASLTLTCGPLR